ncbi:MAG: hypothetical protein WB706_04915 [Nitrososphaeraceae archaeon]
MTAQKNPKIKKLFILVFLAAAIAFAPLAFEFHGILALNSAGQDKTGVSAEHQPEPLTIETMEKYVAFLAGIAEIAIVFLL